MMDRNICINIEILKLLDVLKAICYYEPYAVALYYLSKEKAQNKNIKILIYLKSHLS